MMNLHGQNMLITGGNGALGQAAARRAKALGATVFLLDLAFAKETQTNFARHSVDLTDVHAVAAIVAKLPPIHALLNIAGGFAMGVTGHDPDDTQWDAMFQRNVATLRTVIKAVVPSMKARKAGCIVNVGALSALHGCAGMSAYAASKSVVMNLTESLAAELGPCGIRVNAVLPSTMDTPANRQAMPLADPGDWVDPDDIANVMCFLASAQSRAIQGALIPVTGNFAC